ncbi:hypothetical protein GF337_04615 [candidate division KSB1 bacterium]|nr:hypothetical protein [candidate division KSB1 bacterium]
MPVISIKKKTCYLHRTKATPDLKNRKLQRKIRYVWLKRIQPQKYVSTGFQKQNETSKGELYA